MFSATAPPGNVQPAKKLFQGDCWIRTDPFLSRFLLRHKIRIRKFGGDTTCRLRTFRATAAKKVVAVPEESPKSDLMRFSLALR